jgi:hypothetical protein
MLSRNGVDEVIAVPFFLFMDGLVSIGICTMPLSGSLGAWEGTDKQRQDCGIFWVFGDGGKARSDTEGYLGCWGPRWDRENWRRISPIFLSRSVYRHYNYVNRCLKQYCPSPN